MNPNSFILRLTATLCILAFAWLHGVAQLQFRPDGTLKIVQFTDLHYKYGKKASNAATDMMREVIAAEQPDFVIITGDLVYADQVGLALPEIAAPMVETATPWAMVFGNHDEQFDMTLSEIYDSLQRMPHCILPERPADVVSPDYVLDVKASDGSDSIAAALFCLDTHSGAQLPGVGTYAWLNYDQIGWYRRESAARTAQAGHTLPSLMFMHIPLQEINTATEGKKPRMLGTKKEKVCYQALNSGMFASVKEMGDVFAIFFGHDHDNDFLTTYDDVVLAYGRYSGGKTVYNHLGKNGARVIVLHEGTPAIDTWLRLRGGETLYHWPE